MKTDRSILIISIFLGVLFLLFLMRQWAAPSGGPSTVSWNHDFPAAKTQAAGDGKNMLVCFTASWCGPCKRMKQTTWNDETVGQATKNFVPVLVDFDANRPLARQYNVTGIPYVALLRPDGTVIRARSGYVEPGEMVNWLTAN